MWLTSEGTSGTPWCLLHGFAGNAESWRPLLNASPNHPTVHRATLPGHGGAAFDCGDFVGCITKLNNTFQASEPAHLIGYSLGGRLALGWACTYPSRFRQLTLIGAHPGLASDEARAQRHTSDELWATKLRSEGIEAFVSAWEEQPIFESQHSLPETVRASQRETRASHDPVQLAGAMVGLSLAAMPDYRSQLAALPMPVTLIAGEQDAKFRGLADAMAQSIPRATRIDLPSGHNPLLECPQELAKAIATAID